MSCWHSIIQKRIGEQAITPRGSWTGELRDPVCRSAVDFCGGTTTKFRCAYFKYKCVHIPWRLASIDFAKVKLFVSEISLKSLVNQILKISTSTAYDFTTSIKQLARMVRCALSLPSKCRHEVILFVIWWITSSWCIFIIYFLSAAAATMRWRISNRY